MIHRRRLSAPVVAAVILLTGCASSPFGEAPPDAADVEGWTTVVRYDPSTSELTLVDRTGSLVRTLPAPDGQLFSSHALTAIPGRLVATRLSSSGQLAVLDAATGTVTRVDAHGAPYDDIVVIGWPAGTHAVAPSDDFGVTVVDLETLVATRVPDVSVPGSHSIGCGLGGCPSGLVSLYSEGRTVVIDVASPQGTTSVEGHVLDISDDLIFAQRQRDDGTVEVVTYDRSGQQRWVSEPTRYRFGLILDDRHVLASDEDLLDVIDTSSGSRRRVDYHGLGLLRWLGGRRRMVTLTDDGFAMLDQEGRTIATYPGLGEVAYPMTGPSSAPCAVIAQYLYQGNRKGPSAVVDIDSGAVLGTLSGAPTHASADACTASSLSAGIADLFHGGRRIELDPNEVVLAIASDGTAALTVDVRSGAQRIRLLDGSDGVIPLPGGGTWGAFITL